MKRKYYVLRLPLLIIGVFLFFSVSCDSGKGRFTDPRDGNVYKTVIIGEQVWMAENLKYLPSVVGPVIRSQITPHYYVCGYNGIDVNAAKATENYNKYGVLYNWTAALNACPSGWRLPSNDEWMKLINYLGGEAIAGGKLKSTGTTHFNSPNTGATNETGFTALPGGFRSNDGDCFGIGLYGFWWSSIEGNSTDAWNVNMDYNINNINLTSIRKELGFSVRCVKD